MASASDHRAHAVHQPADCLILLPQRLPAAVETSIGPAHYPPSAPSQTRSFNRACAPVTGAQTLIRLTVEVSVKVSSLLYTPITEIIGSGPFRFVKSEYLPGAKLVYEKNPFYVARSEPASGFSGGKLVKVDRVEFIIIPDATVAIAALRNGEVDFIDSPSLDVVPTVADDPNIVTGEVWPIETYAVLRPNSIQPPFNNVKARLALAYMSDQREYMTAAYGDPKYWRECYAYWVCGSPNGIEVGSEDFRHPNLEKARQLIIESGYKGEKVVLIGGADVPAYNTLTLVTADRLKKIGINVDLQLSDWGSVSARRAKKDPPDQGGWNLFHTSANGAQLASPLVSPSTIMTCDGKNFVGWPCDEKEEALRQQYIQETDPEKQKALVEAMHAVS